MFQEGISYNTIIIAIIIIIIIVFVVYKLYNKEGFSPFQRVKKVLKEHFDFIDLKEDNTMANTLNKVIEEKEKEDNNETPDGITEDLDIEWNDKADKYKPSSYLEGERGNDYKELDLQDEYETQMAKSIDYSQMNNNDQFVPNDQGNGNYAQYTPTKEEYTVKDLMNSEKLLPQEVNQNFFDVVEDPITVKNRHLINITSPIGINSIGSSMKNACLDIRGNIPAPKYSISPFLNGTIEPDVATVGFCNSNVYQ